MLSEMARFNAARRYGLPLFAIGALLGVIGLAFMENGSLPNDIFRNAGKSLAQPLIYAGAALWIAAAGFISAALMSFTRQGCVETESRQRVLSSSSARPATASSKFSRYRHAMKQFAASLFSPAVWRDEKVTEWPLMLVPLVFGAAAALEIVQTWRQPVDAAPDLYMKLLGGGLIVLAFPLLVLQRHYANFSAELLPEAPQLERLTRVPLAVCTGIAVAMILLSAGFSWAIQIERLTAVIVLLVAAELILRSITTLFMPRQTIAHRRAVADSTIAGFLLRLTPPSIQSISIGVRRQFGVDLSRSWALAFVLRAALPIAAGIGVFAWLVTGVTALPQNQRGVYQRFGVPVAVFGPGLHLHLPWPMGIVTTTEIGVVHQLPIEFVLPTGNGQPPPEEKEVIGNAEAVPPPSADRLWDDAHPYEGSYLIASQENGQQSFQLVDVDMAVVYQIGVSDRAARDAAYRVTDPEGLIQALSGQILVRYLAQNTLLNLLGQSRESFASQFQDQLQKQLDNFSTGLQVLAISVEAIHPPPEAAMAYHDVQAAEIRAGIRVAESKGDAVRAEKFAQMEAATDVSEATGAAAELVGQAQTASVLFGGDRQAYAKNGNVFLLERWFNNLNNALGKSEFIVIDHRLNSQEVPTLDLRDFSSSARFDNGAPAGAPPDGAAPDASPQTQPRPGPPTGGDDDD
jgi:regulator of protease activity HflC (stomatin/prohibitin superfamily)